MDNEQKANLLAESEAIFQSCRRFCFPVRAREYKLIAINDLDAELIRLSTEKKSCVAVSDEDGANFILATEYSCRALQHELKMWVALDSKNANSAWDELIYAQTSASAIIQAHPWFERTSVSQYWKYLDALQHILFPPQHFVSSGLIIFESRCSICSAIYGECIHLVGKAYWGEMCSRKITECHVHEISFVDEPANRLARVFTITSDGFDRDIMSWTPIEKQSTTAEIDFENSN